MFTKGGGVFAQLLAITALVPPLGVTAVLVMIPIVISLALFLRYGSETKGLDLRHLESSRPPSPPSRPMPTARLEV
jgi:putative MFS transporter